MNRAILILLSLSFLACIEGRGQHTFQKEIIEEVGISYPTSILVEADGYLIASYGYSEEDNGGAYYRSGIKLVRTDLEGNVLWKRKYNEAGKSFQIGFCGSLVKTTSGYLLGADEGDSLSGGTDFCLFQFDSAGMFVQKTLYPGGYHRDNMLHGSGTSDGGYIMTGQTTFQVSDYYVLKTDSNGNREWAKTYGGVLSDIGRKVHQLSDGNYLVSGTSENYGHGGFDLWLLNLDSAGTVRWEKSYGTGGDDRLRHITLSKSGILAWGRLDTVVYNTENQYAAMVMKLDSSGNVIWRTFFKHEKERLIHQLKELHDGSIVAIGEQQIGTFDSIYGWIAKLNPAGDILWERFYSGFVTEGDSTYTNLASFNADFEELPDGFIVAGGTWKTRPPVNVGFPELWLIKLDTNGCFGDDSCGLKITGIKKIHSNQDNATIVTYPNPFDTQTLISIKASSSTFANEKIQFRLFDASGKLLQEEDHVLNQYGYCEFYLNRNQYPPGIYFYRVTTREVELGQGKLVIR